jgi:hypothetical protein
VSAITSQHRRMAEAALVAAVAARRDGQHQQAAALASSARVHADLCRDNATLMSAVDANDCEAASAAAAEAEDIIASGGRTPSRGQWRTPGTGNVTQAKATLENLHRRAVARGVTGSSSGRRSLYTSRWS